jgi:hypothetical protein
MSLHLTVPVAVTIVGVIERWLLNRRTKQSGRDSNPADCDESLALY